MPTGYKLYPNIQMKIEDERAGRLDYVYETQLNANECMSRIGNPVSGKLSLYETEIRDGVLYIRFTDTAQDTGGLFVPPLQQYAVRFESMGEKTIIRVRYIWKNDKLNVQYYLREDIDAFFMTLFDASVSEEDKISWTDSAEGYVREDPLKIHGSRKFWIISAIFVVLWVVSMFLAGIRN